MKKQIEEKRRKLDAYCSEQNCNESCRLHIDDLRCGRGEAFLTTGEGRMSDKDVVFAYYIAFNDSREPMEEVRLKPCPFCGGTDLELKDYTEELYGFCDYKIRCRTCRAYMDSPSTAETTVYDGVIRQRRDDETKAKAKRELIIAWNRRANDGKAD